MTKASIIQRTVATLVIGGILSTVSALSLADRTTTNSYYANGLLQTIDGPRTDVADITSFEYTAQGYLSKVTNALGHETQMLDHNGRGQAGRMIDANGATTLLTYHPRGYLTSSIVQSANGNAVTNYVYDAVGQVTKITLADGSELNYEYDAAQRLTAMSNNLDERIEYTLDAADNRTQTQIRDGDGSLVYTHQKAFDELNRLLNDTGSNGQNTAMAYDLNGNPTAETDALNNATLQAFDPLNRLQQMTDAKQNTVDYTYDAQDRIKTVTDQNGRTTSYNYNAYGDVVSQQSPSTGTTAFTYDDAGNVTQRTDSRGIVTTYSYDALNRLTAMIYPGNANENVIYQYDATTANKGIGRLTSIVNTGSSLTFVFDDRGNTIEVLNVVNGSFYFTLYAYDAANNLSQTTYPSGRIVQYGRDAVGRISSINTQTDSNASSDTLLSNITYLPYGPLQSLTFGNGIQNTREYDADYRVSSIITGSTQNKLYSYDAANNITGIDDSLDVLKTQGFSYDELYFLAQDTGQYGNITYTYDPLGNRAEKTSSTTTSPAEEQVTFAYNNANRMVSVSRDGNLAANYTYNALGQRVRKELLAEQTVTVYIYNLNGQLIEEETTQANGSSTSKDYVWLEGEPVAMQSANDTYYLHADHLSTPRLATNSSQQTIWRWDSDAFGVGEANADVDGDGEEVDIALRFPGQYRDGETGLYYNYFRDYDAGTGRYVQSDPIGLSGGVNTYGYVDQSPINYIDSYGLASSSKKRKKLSKDECESSCQKLHQTLIQACQATGFAFYACKEEVDQLVVDCIVNGEKPPECNEKKDC